jgi:hypothetical protein
MSARFPWCALRTAAVVCAASLVPLSAVAQSAGAAQKLATPTISLAHDTKPDAARIAPAKGDAPFENTPANFHVFAAAKAGEDAGIESLTLNFSNSTKLGKIASNSKDFIIEPSGTCHEGNAYSAGESCTLHVRFSPQGAGHRLGKITVEHSASATPFALGLGGNGYAPVISFTPAIITTVAGTYPSNAGLLSGAQNLTVDGNDTLYVADTGNNAIRDMDSSGNWTTLASGYTSPIGVAVDTMGEVYFDLNGSNNMYEIYDYGPVVQINGTTTGACTASAPCTLDSHALTTPGTMSMDRYNNLFFADADAGVAMSTVQPTLANLIYIYDPFPFQRSPSTPIAVDSEDNIYSIWANGGDCQIMQSSLYYAENSKTIFNKIAGGHTCGFSGDGGQAGNAEIQNNIGQMAFDITGNLYFTDTSNQRVRRIDYTTGQINTIAGTGTAGYTNDNNQATLAELSSPTGVTVDSQGQVYIISSAATGQVIRKLGPNGFLNLGSQLKGSSGTAHLVTVANTGNNTLELTNVVINGTNPSEFKIDPTTTSCLLTAGSTLNAGESCKIGIIFTPTAGGAQTANLVLLDNTVTNSNTVQLYGIGTLPSPTIKITSPASGTSVTAGTAITFTTTVTSTTTPAPTGTVAMTLDGATISGSPVTLSSGTASLSVTTSTTGSHTLKAVYSGDANYASVNASTTYTVTAAASKLCPTCAVHAHPIRATPAPIDIHP